MSGPVAGADTGPARAAGALPRGVALRVNRVSHTFDDGTEALREVDLEVSACQLVALIGPSGCGKSTLLRLVAGLLPPSGGTIECDRSDIGYVFQDPTLLPWRTVLRNVELFGELHGMAKAERRRKAREVLRSVGLEGFEGKYPKALSGGMRMRASLARSLLLRPRLFLFDEPFAAADEITRQRLNDELMSLYGRERFAGVFVTHSIVEACYLSARVLVMTTRPGQILGQVELPFGYPRTEQLRYEPGFIACASSVSAMLHEASWR